jgi:hypothetical protein
MDQEMCIDYDVTSEFAGHSANKKVPISKAARDIFGKVKEKAMQVAVKGTFIVFNTVDELIQKLSDAAINGYSIRVHDEDIGA